MIRLGAPLFQPYDSPEGWVAAVRQAGFRAAYCPIDHHADDETITAYAEAAEAADICIAEVGAWSNPLSPDPAERQAALEKCQQSLALADKIGARCCVNIAGSRGKKWDGPSAADYEPDTFELIVTTVREIIDVVRPRRTFYTLETMPWLLPDSPQSYLALLNAIDRPAFAVHFDPVNLINSPRRYYQQRPLLKEFFTLLGPYIKSCHAKDVIIRPEPLVHLSEVTPGQGRFDYSFFLWGLKQLGREMAVMLEHVEGEADYQQGARFIRRVATEEKIPLA